MPKLDGFRAGRVGSYFPAQNSESRHLQPLAYARGSERLLITRVLIPSRDRKGAALYTRKQILRRKLASVKLSHSGLIQTLNVMPAVAAGVTDGLWEVSEVIRLLEEGKALLAVESKQES